MTGESDGGRVSRIAQGFSEGAVCNIKSKYNYQSTTAAASILQNMLPEVRQLFDQVETFVRLVLVFPVSSAVLEDKFTEFA